MLRGLRLKWKINLLVILIVVIIMLVVAFTIYNNTSNIVFEQVNEKIEIMTDYQVKLLKRIIERKQEEVKDITLSPMIYLYTEFAYNKKFEYDSKTAIELQELRNDNNEMSFNELVNTSGLVKTTGNKLNNLVSNIEYARLAYLTTVDGTVIADSRYTIEKKPRDNIYTDIKLIPSMYKDIRIGSLVTIDGKLLFLINSAIYVKGKIVGYAVVGFSAEMFKKNLDTEFNNYGQITLVNQDGIILNHDNQDMIGKTINNNWFYNQISNNVQNVSIVENRSYKLINNIPELNLFFAISIPLNVINNPAAKIRNTILKISVIGISIIFLIVTIALSFQLKPLNQLINRMKQVRQGDMDVNIKVNTDDEIGELASNFNKMIFEIKNLLKKIKDDQEEIRKVEFQALQSQINPHFLYNTLDFIYWMTKTKEYDAIGKMAIALSQFFRLALNKGRDITTIAKEIEHVKNYLLIQKLRYPHKFTWQIKVEPVIYQNECIKLILQPLVENALLHGFKDIEEGGLVKITGTKVSDQVIFEVSDNGCGADVLALETMIADDNGQAGYAVRNVNNRIKLYYGPEYGLSFYNNQDGGTTVKVTLPCKTAGGDKNV